MVADAIFGSSDAERRVLQTDTAEFGTEQETYQHLCCRHWYRGR